MRRFDRDRVKPDPETPSEVLGVRNRVIGGVPRGHGDATNMAPAQCVDGDGGHDGRVDPAGESDDDVGEAVLGQVVACAEDQRGIDLTLLGPGCGHLAKVGRIDPSRGSRDLDQRLGDLGDITMDDEVSHKEMLEERGGLSHHASIVADDHRAAVEDELVLAADLVHVDHGTASLAHPISDDLASSSVLSDGERGGIDAHHELSPHLGHGGRRTAWGPQVLTHGHPNHRIGDPQELGSPSARDEPSLLVEHGVVREKALGNQCDELSVGTDRRHVGQQRSVSRPTVTRWTDPADQLGGRNHRTHDDRAVSRRGGHLVECPASIGHEPLFEQQVLRWVAGDGEFREGDQVAADPLGLDDGGEHQLNIARQVADGRVDLGGGHPQRAHRTSLTAAPWRLGPIGEFTQRSCPTDAEGPSVGQNGGG